MCASVAGGLPAVASSPEASSKTIVWRARVSWHGGTAAALSLSLSVVARIVGGMDPLAGNATGGDRALLWGLLGALADQQAAGLTAPAPARGRCVTCFGPAAPGRIRCFQCDLHVQCAPGSLASVVLPVAYAAKGGSHACHLWTYKSGQPGAQAARRVLAVLLLVFLREHGPCLWDRAGWAASQGGNGQEAIRAGPTHLAVVPSCRGREGPHPLRALAQPCLRLPWAELATRPGADGRVRDLDPKRFTVVGPPGAGNGGSALEGARVLLLDDTWTTGASVQSAAMALRRAGASDVAAVILGRHLRQQDGTAAPFSPGRCAIHLSGG
ncbi:MAG: hypothetical protein ACRDNZ_14950 [Streptosporangiaceae bacterium]